MIQSIGFETLRVTKLLFAVMLAISFVGCIFIESLAAAEDAKIVQRTDANAPLEKWGTLEIELQGPSTGNPFQDVELTATFQLGGNQQKVTGFYDGGGLYRVRFMPDRVGQGTYTTHSNAAALDGKTGKFTVVAPSADNHGPVHVSNKFHFAYADGTPYRQLGTTCYAWIHQGDALEGQTLETLAGAPFNKLRMCVFPKRYKWNENEPLLCPYEGTPPDQWDFSQFNPAFFQHLEQRVKDLRALGIEADIILFHPYDEGHWGFDRMTDDQDDFYLRYVVSRLAAYRNVWWSLANEFDFMPQKQESDWDRFIEIVAESDPYGRLRSIHNGREIYNHNNPLITHASIQNGSAAEEAGRAILYRDVYRKPVVFDEIKYEGNIPSRWGNLSGPEMAHRFWECIIAGTYPGHGETIMEPSDVLWWSKGGILRGESPQRIAFLKKILETSPPEGLEPIDKWQHPNIVGKAGEYYLVYFGKEEPTSWKFFLTKHELTDGMKFHVDVLDTWNMTVTPIDEPFTVRRQNDYVFVDQQDRAVELPGRPWMALRITRVED